MKVPVLFAKVCSPISQINIVVFILHPPTDLNVTQSNCTDYDVKLVDGPGINEGKIIICINEVWGTLCNSGITYNIAGIICLELGYQRGLD